MGAETSAVSDISPHFYQIVKQESYRIFMKSVMNVEFIDLARSIGH
ncbi:hypothetical protein HMPREF0880_01459 [Yokenella regensburgei ATCC 43003]|jgi:hypothetical protein|nr:hypothetical protein HMPREF0880_01459 [Yokenella regensburgei ATCC 43003]